jgi:hypothetical protein
LPARSYSSRAFFTRTCGVDDHDETMHVDQHAKTARAIEQWMAIQPSRREGCQADWTRT